MFFTLLCLSPFILLALPFIAGAIIDVIRIRERNVRNAMQAERLAALAEARLHRAMVSEARIAAEHNKTMEAELKIELLTLKIRKERNTQGLDAPDFNPSDYPQP